MWLSLSACVYISASEHEARVRELSGPPGPTDTVDTVDTTDTPTGPGPTVGAVDPAHGSDAGGTEVTIVGGPFGDAPTVKFGEEPADVLSVSADTLVVEAPPNPVPEGDGNAVVDVSVTTQAGTGENRGAFTYWPDATGQVGATGELVWFRNIGYMEGEEDYGRSLLRFTQPTDYAWYKNWTPTLDSCTHILNGKYEYTYMPDFVSIEAGPATVTETSPSSAIELTWNAAEQRYVAIALPTTAFSPGETYDLMLQGSSVLPDFTLTGVFPVPAPFTIDEPDLEAPSPQPFTRTQHFGWSTDDSGDAVVLQVGLVNATYTAFEEELWCATSDVGSFTLPDLWQSWAPDRQVHVLFGRYREGIGELPWNNGQIAVASSLWYYGVGLSQ